MAKASSKGLGKGLGALFAEETAPEPRQEATSVLPLHKIEPNPHQPRREFDPEALAVLAESIAENGLIQPIAVRPMDGGYYQIIAGERRWRACRLAGLKEVPVNILEVGDKTASQLALIENLQREDLNPLEEAQGYADLMQQYGMTQEEAAKSVGKSRPAVANALRLLNLPESLRDLVSQGTLSAGHARALLPLGEEALQRKAAEQIIAGELSVRQAEALVKRLMKPPVEEKQPDILHVDYIKECEKQLTRSMGRKVSLHHGKKKGKLELEYYGEEDLQTLMDALSALPAPVRK